MEKLRQKDFRTPGGKGQEDSERPEGEFWFYMSGQDLSRRKFEELRCWIPRDWRQGQGKRGGGWRSGK